MHERREVVLRPPTHIEVVYAGGTISSLATPLGYREGGHVVDLAGRLQEKIPTFGKGIRLGNAEVAYTGLSENIDFNYWESIEAKVSQALQKNPHALVLTHGTDSMEQTAKYLHKKLGQHLIENSSKLILTGANEDLQHPQTDAWNNLHFAFESGQSDAPAGTYIAFHRKLIPADLAVKEPYNGREMNYASIEDVEYRQALNTSLLKAEKEISQLRRMFQARPDIAESALEYEANIVRPNHQELFNKLKNRDIKSVLLVLYHSGTANTEKPALSVSELVKNLRTKRGIVAFGVSENGEPINLHSYETSVRLREAGVVPLYNMQREVALEKLKLVSRGTSGQIIDRMLSNKVGEINEGTVIQEDIIALKQLYRA